MRSSGFDYGYTCPSIDRSIANAKDEITSFLEGVLSDACGLLPDKLVDDLAKNYADSLYSSLEDIFENVRSENEKMRSEAESQISRLSDEINDLHNRIGSLEEIIENLEGQIE